MFWAVSEIAMWFLPLLLGSVQDGAFVLLCASSHMLFIQFQGRKVVSVFFDTYLVKEYNNQVALLQNNKHDFHPPLIIW